VFKRGEAPLLKFSSPSPRVERGIKGVRLIKILSTLFAMEGISNI
jgi:hypothetical protein